MNLATTGLYGHVQKLVTVKLSSSAIGNWTQSLKLTADLPQPLVTLDHTFVSWDIDEDALSKAINLRINIPDPIHVLSATVSGPETFSVKIVEVEAGHLYQIVVKPSDTAGERYARIVIATDAPNESDRAIGCFAVVMRVQH